MPYHIVRKIVRGKFVPGVELGGTVYPISEDFEQIEYLEPVSQTRHCFEHSLMRQPSAVYPVGDLSKT
tara:strand:- start:373 stop:576 length:204 start_codon:yes stop_codon:yes gene_type:complete